MSTPSMNLINRERLNDKCSSRPILKVGTLSEARCSRELSSALVFKSRGQGIDQPQQLHSVRTNTLLLSIDLAFQAHHPPRRLKLYEVFLSHTCVASE